MKKIMIITGILLLSVAAFAQRNYKSENAARRTATKPKTETAVKRSTTPRQRNQSAAQRTVRNPNTVNAVRRSTTPQQRNESTAQRTVRNLNTVNAVRREGQHQRTESSTRGNGQGRVTQPVTKRTVPEVKKPASTRHEVTNRTPDPVLARRTNGQERANTNPTARNAEQRKNYTTPNRRSVRGKQGHNTHYVPVKSRKVVYRYRSPGHLRVVWTPRMYREYRILYPEFRYWYYPLGYTIVTVPAYHAYFHIGEVRNVYGRIHEVWYSWTTDEYYLYFGNNYPYQDFTVILPGKNARRFSHFPETYFEGRYIWVTGLVSTFEGKPEIMVRRNSQVHLY